MKWVHMGNKKLSVDCELLYHLCLLSIHPYGVDGAYLYWLRLSVNS